MDFYFALSEGAAIWLFGGLTVAAICYCIVLVGRED